MKQRCLFTNGRVCRICKKDLPISEFYKKPKGRYGLSSYCKSCEIEKSKARYTPANPVDKECIVCDKTFSSTNGKKYCDDCNYIHKRNSCRVYYFYCKGCNKLSTTGQKRRANYCKHECYSKNADHFGTHDYSLKCVTCGNGFTSNNPNAKYCNDKCKKRTSKLYTGKCPECTKSFVSRYKRKYCSDDCYYKTKLVNERDVTCSDCGDIYKTNNGNSKYCFNCSEIRRKECNKERKKKYGSHRKRARTFGVEYQFINRLEVYKRDRYKCQECGIKTLKSKAGTNHNREPTLDHIIPMSKGGPHNYHNVQTLCRKCNTNKGSLMLGQKPMLFRDGSTHGIPKSLNDNL